MIATHAADGYALGESHGYDIAAEQLGDILWERMQAGEDVESLRTLLTELRSRKASALKH